MLKDEIIRLGLEGKTYSQIVDELGCAKSTVSYYLGDNQSEKRQKRQRDRRNNIRKMVAQIKYDAVCADCKIDYPPHVLQFDHVRGVKRGTVTELIISATKEDVLEEIAKCEIVCANCHAERTYSRIIRGGGDASYDILKAEADGK